MHLSADTESLHTLRYHAQQNINLFLNFFHTRSLLHYHAAWDLTGSISLFYTSNSSRTVSMVCTVQDEIDKSNENPSMSYSSRNGMILLQRVPHEGEKTVRSSAQIKIPWPQKKIPVQKDLQQEFMVIALFMQQKESFTEVYRASLVNLCITSKFWFG